MTTNKGKQADGKSAGQPKKKPAFVTRYVAVDSHLSERNGSTDSVYGLAGERPAGRKLAQDIASTCNQLDAEGYNILSIVPITSGRAVEATVEAAELVHGRTYSQQVEVEPESSVNQFGIIGVPMRRYETKHYVDTGVGYSVTDGVVITAQLRK